MEQSIKDVLMKQTIKHQQTKMTSMQSSAQKQQALVIMCRVYVGSIYYDIDHHMIRDAFTPFGTIKSLDMSYDPITGKHKGYCFIDFEIPEAAHLAAEQMATRPLSLGPSRTIKVGRPSNIGQVTAIMEQLATEANRFNRVYISSIHPDLEENDLRSVFEAFGKILSCQLDRDMMTGKHRGYAFIEYETLQASMDAISSMNMFDLGGQYLRVGKAITPPSTHFELLSAPSSGTSTLPPAAALAAAAVTSKIMAQEAAHPHRAATNAAPGNFHYNIFIDVCFNGTALLPQPAAVLAANKPGVVTGRFSLESSSLFFENAMTLLLFMRSTLISYQLLIQYIYIIVTIIPQIQYLYHCKYYTTNTIFILFLLKGVIAYNCKIAQSKSINFYCKESFRKVNGKEILPTTAHTLSQQEGNMNISGSSQRHFLMQKLMRKVESTVMVLRNMVEVEDVDDDLEAEITEECGKFGCVKRVVIYQEKQGEEDGAPVIVKIFVEFSTEGECENAVTSLNNRWFGGKKVTANLYPQELYAANDLTG
uniref:RRM domain-containing protein n=1 Tax=Ciona savignyi TaxID=51511 RepID=H2YAK9_CIOSA